jgi:hypothetical protein
MEEMLIWWCAAGKNATHILVPFLNLMANIQVGVLSSLPLLSSSLLAFFLVLGFPFLPRLPPVPFPFPSFSPNSLSLFPFLPPHSFCSLASLENKAELTLALYTQELATLVSAASIPDGKILQKNLTGVIGTTQTPPLEYSDELFYMVCNVSSPFHLREDGEEHVRGRRDVESALWRRAQNACRRRLDPDTPWGWGGS